MTTSSDTCIDTRREGRLLVISMRREAKRNAINREMADQLDAALNQLDDDDSLWAGVLTGTDSIFCAGSDLTCNGDYITERGGEYGIIRRVRRKPLVAAVEGSALGGGLEIVLSCDLVVASSAARFGLPEVSEAGRASAAEACSPRRSRRCGTSTESGCGGGSCRGCSRAPREALHIGPQQGQMR